MCGFGPSDADPFDRRRKVQLTLRMVGDDPENADHLKAICTNCMEGLRYLSPPKPDRLELMRQLRRATIDDQRYALTWLEQKFNKEREV